MKCSRSVNFPDLMFLDEPTTGLDSAVSLEVIAAVRNLANQNRTVICTIHSPSLETGSLFDKLLLMASGRVIFFGPVSNVADYFFASPYQFYCGMNTNPFDFAVAVAGGFVLSVTEQKIPGNELADFYANGEGFRSLTKSLNDVISLDMETNATEASSKVVEHKAVELPYNTSLLHQIKTLSLRSFTVLFQNKKLIIATVMRYIIVAIFYGTIFLHLKTGIPDYFSRMSIFFFSLMFLIMAHQASIPQMLNDRLLFYRERGAKAYGALPYWMSTWITQVPIVILATLCFALVIYWMVGFRENGFGWYLYFMLAVSLCGLFFSQFLAAVSSSSEMALTLTPLLILVIILFAGFLVYVNAFSEWLGYWGPYISFIRYAFQGLVLNEFYDNHNLIYGQNYIDLLGFGDISKESCGAIMVGFVAGMGLAVFVALKYVNFEKR